MCTHVHIKGSQSVRVYLTKHNEVSESQQEKWQLLTLPSSEIKGKIRAKTQKIKRSDITIQQLNADTSASNLLTFVNI